ncbi:MAG: hypothetical protein ACK5LL_13775 [Suipraeoptans sp.]
MTSREWIEIIEKNYENLISEGIKTYEESLRCEELVFVVGISKEGNVSSWCGTDSRTIINERVISGECIELARFNSRYEMPLDITSKEFRKEMDRQNLGDLKDEICSECYLTGSTFMTLIYKEYKDSVVTVLQEVKNRAINQRVAEYGRMRVKVLLTDTVEKLRNARDMHYLKPRKEVFYFTFGTDSNYPFSRGWVEVQAKDRKSAVEIFRSYYPDRWENIVNCADIYSSEQMHETDMLQNGNLGLMCHKVLSHEKPKKTQSKGAR